jgi:hypothetical protein
MVEKLTHPSVLATAGAGVVLVAASTVTDVPWWLWAAWAALGAMSVGQAVRQ